MFEYEHWKQNDLYSSIKLSNILDNTITTFPSNAQALSKEINDMVSEDRIINNNIIGFTETQTHSSDFTCKTIKALNFFNINFSLQM